MVCGDGTIGAGEERKVVRVAGHGRLAAHVVVVVALRRRRGHEGRRRRQARGPSPRAAREGVHGGERAHVAHVRGALAAGRLRPPHDRYFAPQPPAPRALFDRRPPSVLPFARPRTASLCFEFLIYRHSSNTCFTLKCEKELLRFLESDEPQIAFNFLMFDILNGA